MLRRIPLFALLCIVISASLAYSQTTWTDQTTSAGIGGILNDVDYGDGLYVAVGTNSTAGLIYSSEDGVTWTSRTSSANLGGILNGIAYGDGSFVTVGTNSTYGLIGFSYDGINWNNFTSSASIGGILNDVAYGNGTWVAVGETGSVAVVATSTTGAAWTNRTSTLGIGGNLKGVAYGNGKFVAVGTNGARVVFLTSEDGRDWQDHTVAVDIGGVAYSVAYDGSRFVATGEGTLSGGSTTAHVLVSEDGETWTNLTQSAGLGGIGYGVAGTNGTSVLVGRTGSAGLLAYSDNGSSWTNLTSTANAPGDLNGVAVGPTLWVAVGTNAVNGVVVTSEASSSSTSDPIFFESDIEAGPNGGNYTVNVLAGSSSSWTATEDSSWISLTNPSGTGNGAVQVNVSYNPDLTSRSATVALGSNSLVVNQSGSPLITPSWYSGSLSSEGVVTLRWSQAYGSDGYELQRRLQGDSAFTTIANVSGASSITYDDTTFVSGYTYEYQVRSVAGSVVSDWSTVRTVATPPAIPDGFDVAVLNPYQARLTWNDVTGESGYLIYRALGADGNFSQVGRTAADVTSFVDVGLQELTLYRYRIEAESSIYGRYSEIVSATTSEDTRSIVWSHSSSGLRSYNDVAFADGVWVAVGSGGWVSRSTDASSWSDVDPGVTVALNDVASRSGQFVAVGDDGTIIYSTDGSSWTEADSGLSERLVGVAYGTAGWISVGESGGMVSSADGIVWSAVTSIEASEFVSIFYGGATYFAIEGSGRVVSSADGATWTEVRASASTDAELQPYFWTRTAGVEGNGSFSMVGPNSYSSNSSDGVTWNEVSEGDYNYFNSVAYGNGQFVAVGINGSVGTSATGASYASSAYLQVSLNGVAFGNGIFVSVGERGFITSSSDGSSWTTRNAAVGSVANLTVIAAGAGQLVAFGDTDTETVVVVNDFDGLGWNEHVYSADSSAYMPLMDDALYLGSNYVAVGNEGLALTSTDGVTWTTTRNQEAGAINDFLRTVAAGQGKVIAAGGSDGLVVSQDDGATWQAVSDLPSGFHAWSIAYADGNWATVFPGQNDVEAYRSSDGSTWTLASVSGTNVPEIDMLTTGSLYGSSLWLGLGSSYDGSSAQAMVSADGANWNASSVTGIDGDVKGLAYGAGLFVAVGDGSSVWASMNGIDWEASPVGYLSQEIANLGGFRDVVFYLDRFYAVGVGGTVVELFMRSSDSPAGPVLDPAEVLVTSRGNGLYTLTWSSDVGVAYQLETVVGLGTESWVSVGSPLNGTGSSLSVDVDLQAGASVRFWRIRTLEP
ncbi:beta strand repeat-containing protein [Pelagicoccus albus]|uniref:Fibronectin type-III domain-containing protein n=1 Tax=Pelagicoccus albus TaxID=415222 RepID=A0A7X1E7X5_9BACT|nr:BACON domain-containing carbohydrate-binding protein [Pelagicoccus albus]MBC2606215.1 hypothetical protein [Pelagicoccus albus]